MDTRGILEKLFPQVDRRIIRATTIEHKDDLQAAIDFITSEIVEDPPRPFSFGSAESTQVIDQDFRVIDFPELEKDGKVEEPLPDKYSSSSDGPGVWKSASSSIYSVDCESIEKMVEQTKADKESLALAVEEIKDLRRKTDQAEAAARLAKAQALDGGEALRNGAREVQLAAAKLSEANAVHSGEVYGEKAVLGTEAKELFARLHQVKSEWITASAIIEEIKATLQERINNANEEQRTAEEERLQKEAIAQEALQVEEELWAKATQESIELNAEADNCTKLRDFLMERGSIVDSLQGEISILHEDVQLLKKKVDGLVLESFYSTSQAGSSFSVRDNDDNEFVASSKLEKSSSSSNGSWHFLNTLQ